MVFMGLRDLELTGFPDEQIFSFSSVSLLSLTKFLARKRHIQQE
jgi:hypothetical protein